MKRHVRNGGLLALAGGLTMLLVGPFLIPVPPLKRVFPARKLSDEDSEFIDLNGVDIHVKRAGQGQPVFVLLHGFAASLYTWNNINPALSQLGSLITYDRPGFGLSARPLTWEGPNPYSPAAQLTLLSSLLDHFGVERAILVGNSAGGTIAMQAALAFPQRVSSLILLDPAVYRGMGTPTWLRPVLASPQMRRLGPLFTRQLLSRGSELVKLAWHDPGLLSAEMQENYRKPFSVENWDKALWEFTLASQPSHLQEHLDQLTMPVLVITGDDDRIVPTADSMRLSKALPNASLCIIKDAGHVPHEEKPVEVLAAISQFMDRLASEENHAKSSD